MKESDTKLRHMAFFEALAALDAESVEWKRTSAGLLALRLVDAWLEDGPEVACDEWTFHQVRKAVDEVDEGTLVRAILARIVETVHDKKPSIASLITPMMTYARSLEYDAKWALAGDVYQTLLGHLHPIDDAEASVAAHMRVGICARNRHSIDEAALAFSAALQVASAVNDLEGVLRAKIGEASLARLRGNLPAAEAILDETIARAKSAAFGEVSAKAMSERSGVALHAGQYELGIRLAYEALGGNLTPIDRDRTLNNIAGAFTSLGAYSAARDAYLILSATAEEQYMRWTATINLMDLSSLTGAALLFEQYHRMLTGQALPPHLATGLELTLGVGHQRFARFDQARVHLERAVAMALEHGLSQFLFEAEEALASLEKPAPPPRLSAEVSAEIAEVARRIRSLRETAGVG